VDPIPSQAGTATIFPQQRIVELQPEINEAEIPANAPPSALGAGLPTNLANDLASGLFIPPQQQTIVPTPPKRKRHWYQKKFDVEKNTLRHGSS
jgi:hypothetical protein